MVARMPAERSSERDEVGRAAEGLPPVDDGGRCGGYVDDDVEPCPVEVDQL